MGQPNSTPEKSSENVEERKQDYALERLNVRTEIRCLSEMIGYLRNSPLRSSFLRRRFYRSYNEFFGKDPGDTEKISTIADFRSDHKNFIENIPAIIEEFKAELAKREKKIKFVQERKLCLQAVLDNLPEENECRVLMSEKVKCLYETEVKIEEKEEEVKIKLQELIQTFKDTFPETCEIRRLKSENDELRAKLKEEKCESGRQRTENDELREKFKEECSWRIKELVTWIDAVHSENQKLKNIGQEKNQENKKLNDHVEELKEEILNLQKEKKILQEKKDNEKDNVERENQKLEGMVQKIKQEIKRLNDQGKELNDRNQSLQKAMKKLQEKKTQENKRLNDHVEELEDVNQDLQNEMKIQKEKQHLEIQKLVSEKDHLKRENRKLENMVQELGIDKSRETETAEAMEMQKRNEPSTIAQQVTEDDDGRVVPSCVSLRN